MSPTTPVYALRYPASSDPADVPTDMGELATDVEAKLLIAGITYGTTPPASPVDGQLWAYPADTTNGVIWVFRYRSASSSTYKWEAVGATPIDVTTTAGLAFGTPGVWQDVACQFTLPRNGTYRIQGILSGSLSGTSGTTQIGYGLTTPSVSAGAVITPASMAFVIAGLPSPTDFAAAGTVKLWGWANVAGTWTSRTLTVTPIRIS